MASHLGRDEVGRIAKLAHLTIAPDDAPRFAEQLSAILDYAASIQRVDTTGVPPLSGSASLAWREDDSAASLPREVVLEQSPDAAAGSGLFRVPKVL
jgi:aspartyl-tRNA(Asn)/glutamyl-tRNA(Gln) amidotransferase subunit C